CNDSSPTGDVLAQSVSSGVVGCDQGAHAAGQVRVPAEGTPYASRELITSVRVGSLPMENEHHFMLRWCTVVAFAVAMAWVESAVVFYLRTMLNRIEPYQPNPLPMIGGLGSAEMIREAATLVMLMAVGILAGRSWRSRFGYVAVAFGIWDIFYY